MRSFLIGTLISLSSFATETRKEVIVIDTGFTYKLNSKVPANAFCESGLIDLTGTGITDNHGHGTNIIGLISKDVDFSRYCITMIKWYNLGEGTYGTVNEINKKIAEIVRKRNTFLINLSLSGQTFFQDEYNLIRDKISVSTYIVTSAGNERLDLSKACIIYPACYGFKSFFFRVIESGPIYGSPSTFSNFGGPVNGREYGVLKCAEGICLTGTSQSAAIYSNKLLRGLIK